MTSTSFSLGLGTFPLKSKTITAKVKQIQIVEPFNKTPKCLLALKGEIT